MDNDSAMSTSKCSVIETPIPEALVRFWKRIHFIAPHLGVDYPLSPFLKYKYPPANEQIVNNIAKALHQYPEFYHQVLHVMNRMNLMPPFFTTQDADKDSSDDPDDGLNFISSLNDTNNEPTSPECNLKRPKKRLKVNNLSKKKLPDISSTNKSNKPIQKVDDVFENIPLPKRQLMKINVESKVVNNSVHQNDIDNMTVEIGKFGKITQPSTSNENTSENDQLCDLELITEKELILGQLPVKEWINYKALQKYSIGKPCCRLYVKNLGKNVTEIDLNRIFGRYVDWKSEDEKNA